MDDQSTSQADRRRKRPRWPVLARRDAQRSFSRCFLLFHNYFRFCNIFLVERISRHSGLFRAGTSGSRILFPVLFPRPEMECQKLYLTTIMAFQCSLTTSVCDFTPIKMAAKTSSGSGFDSNFGLITPGFLT